MILPSRTSLVLGGALAASVLLNAFLGWQWAQAGAECDTRIAKLQNESVERIGEAVVERDTISRDITKESDDRAAEAVVDSDVATQEAKEIIRYVYVEAEPDPARDIACTTLRPVPDSVQNVIDAAVSRANR